MTKAVFLDRDGVINKYDQPVNSPEDLNLFWWSGEAINKLNHANFAVYVVTNQGGIESGYFTEQDLTDIHQHLVVTLKEEEAEIDDIEYCPHFKTNCNCRKPQPGMVYKLADRYNVDLSLSYLIGDRNSDIIAGNRAGCTTIKLGSKYPAADYSVANLLEATQLILKLDTAATIPQI
jgi:histidinol-phosphate phosphatase family protein